MTQPVDLAYENLLHQREAFRRRVGLWLGSGMGLVFGLISQTINLIALPGLELYQAPFGTVGNILLYTAVGGLLGIVCGWHFGSIEGVLMSSVLGAAILLGSLVASGYRWESLGTRLIGTLSLFLPASAALVPGLAVLRWVINEQEEYRNLTLRSFQRIWRPAFLFLLAAGVGALWLMPDQGLRSLRQMDLLLRSARENATLPQPLSEPDVVDFKASAVGTYSLAWDKYNISRYAIGYYPTAGWEPTAAIARFDNGWMLVCIYTNPDLPPCCKGFGDTE